MLHRSPRLKKPQPVTTRALLDQIAEGDPEEELSLGELLDRFSERSFGLFLLIIMLPTFIPIPVGMGGVSGALSALIGLQFLIRLEHPWLPKFVAERKVHRYRLIGFRNKMARVIGWIERLTRPRAQGMFLNPIAHAFTGLMLVLLGVMLALPVPLTNYPFGLILLAYAFALIERDGWLMLIAWGLGVVEIVAFIGFSSQIIALSADALGWMKGFF